jgi:hypothetical protein
LGLNCHTQREREREREREKFFAARIEMSLACHADRTTYKLGIIYINSCVLHSIILFNFELTKKESPLGGQA